MTFTTQFRIADISTWGTECARGAPYKYQVTEIAGRQASHKISSGRKARGSSADGLERIEARA